MNCHQSFYFVCYRPHTSVPIEGTAVGNGKGESKVAQALGDEVLVNLVQIADAIARKGQTPGLHGNQPTKGSTSNDSERRSDT